MTEAFPLLSAALEQPFEARTPGEDVGHMLDALGLLGSSYHSFDPPAPMPAPPSPQAAAALDPVHTVERTPQPAEDEAASPLEPPPQMNLPRVETRSSDPVEIPVYKRRRELPPQPRTDTSANFEISRVELVSAITLREMFQVIGSSPGASRRRLRQAFSQRGRNF